MKTLRVVTISQIKKHPNAAKLKVCTITDGTETYQVVCGASNVRESMKTIFAPVGSKTPKGVQIEKADLRGVESFGMLCSAKDLNISEEPGIVDLPESIKNATSLSDIDTEYLSSIPWHSYKLIESFWESTDGKISIIRDAQKLSGPKLISKTYFNEGQYLYRHFS